MRFVFAFVGLLALPALLHAQPARPLHAYYGNLHAHTGYSDGNRDSAATGVSTPMQSWAFAKASQHFDFLGISEHNHTGAGFNISRWQPLLQQADSANQDGAFLALAGMEFGIILNGGHVLVYGTRELFGWQAGQYTQFVGQNDYHGLWRQINRRPGCIGSLCHPDNADFNNLRSGAFDASADSALVGSAFRSGPAFSTNLNYGEQSTTSYESYYRALLTRGYHLGPFYDHDNHNTTFGRTTEGRLVVLADTLTRAALMQALRARRFYASDDWNAEVRLTLTAGMSYAMGTQVQEPGTPTLALTVADGDGEACRSIQLLRGVPGSGAQPVVVATGAAGALAVQFTDAGLAAGDSAYYYAVIVQTDNDKIITAPIWYRRGPFRLIGLPEEAAATVPVTVWPNPVSGGSVTVAGPTGATVTVLDVLGRVVGESAALPAAGVVLPVRELAPGLYVVRVVTPGGGVTVRRLVVE